MNGFQDKVNFIWSVADEVLRDDFKRGRYPDVILPFTVLRRLDCVLAPTKEKVLKRYTELNAKGLTNLDGQLRKAAEHSFYNLSRFDFSKLLDDPKNIGKNLRDYINGFSENMREVIDKFKLRTSIDTLDQKGLLFLLIRKFGEVDLHPSAVSNHDMGYIFEELIRRFNEQSNENPGEHFTPREVIRLMVRLVLNGDKDILKQRAVVRTIYDPACGTGGMLSIAKEYILKQFNPHAGIRLFGQEVNDETFAVCKSDMLIKGDEKDADNIKPDTSFSKDGHPNATFDYMLSNPPYGKDWKKEQEVIEAEAVRGHAGRFEAGTPRIDDGQLLFLQHMISKMKPSKEGGSRIAIVHNGSPLFTGDAGSGESEIRRWIIENDWLETIVALPGQLFYNTAIHTYIWVLTNRKPQRQRGKVLLVNGAATIKEGDKEVEVFARKMRKSLGKKRNELGEDHIVELSRLAAAFEEGPYTKIFDTTDFGYRKITVDRPLRLNFQASPERIVRLSNETTFQNLAKSKKKDTTAEVEITEGKKLQAAILSALGKIDSSPLYKNRDTFEKILNGVLKQADLKINSTVKKAIFFALSERDETADICMNANGKPEPNLELRDFENVPLKEDIYTYFNKEVRPYVPDAWINEKIRDHKDGEIGKVGYEISFNRYFYQYQPLRPLEEIDTDIKTLKSDILAILREGNAIVSQAVTKVPKPIIPMKDSGIKWLGKIPAHWDIKQLKRNYEVQLGKMLSPNPTSPMDTLEPYLRAANLEWSGVDISDIKEMWFSSSERAKYCLEDGDLLVSEGGDVGRSAIWKTELPICYIQNAINRVRNKKGLSNQFLYYWLYTLKYLDYIDVLCDKATILHLTAEKLERIPVPTPNDIEQKNISDFLDRETAKIDALIAKIREHINKLQEYRTALISAAVTGKICVHSTQTTKLQPRRANIYFQRTVLATEIVYHQYGDNTFGRVKFQKELFLITHHLGLSVSEGSYLRDAAGPFNNKMIRSLESQMKRSKWFQAITQEGLGTHYQPMEKTGRHKEYFDRYWGEHKESIKKLIDLLRPLNSKQCEIIATLYAAWNDFIISGEQYDDEMIIQEVLTNWHKSKEQISEARWRDGLQWMRTNGLEPKGFGQKTRNKI